MSPRKPESPPEVIEPKSLSEVIAANIRRQRKRQNWNQEKLAGQMRLYGFEGWRRTTVTEVEGAGRGRQISVGELLGLAQVFGVGLDALLWHHDSQGTNSIPLEIMPKTEKSEGFRLDNWLALLGLIMTPESLAAVASRAGNAALEETLKREYTRMYTEMIERVQEVAEDLRNTAGWFETKAIERLVAPVASKEES